MYSNIEIQWHSNMDYTGYNITEAIKDLFIVNQAIKANCQSKILNS